ncbi:response regulator transcription factor, partial [Pseudomonas sp.]
MSDSTDRPLRVIVADDHPIFLIGLRVVLEQDNLATVVAEACNPDELLQVLARHPCDVLVTDFMMPVELQNDGLRLVQRIHRDFPALPVIVVTTLSNAGLFQSMLDLN